ncbi:hypothetical protein C8R45DRAFT_1221024 [Mycena sanguinolenta]|nr:hypothetical protein C8R45DRAFT_1221024 [Mycena sanguinolenta]
MAVADNRSFDDGICRAQPLRRSPSLLSPPLDSADRDVQGFPRQACRTSVLLFTTRGVSLLACTGVLEPLDSAAAELESVIRTLRIARCTNSPRQSLISQVDSAMALARLIVVAQPCAVVRIHPCISDLVVIALPVLRPLLLARIQTHLVVQLRPPFLADGFCTRPGITAEHQDSLAIDNDLNATRLVVAATAPDFRSRFYIDLPPDISGTILTSVRTSTHPHLLTPFVPLSPINAGPRSACPCLDWNCGSDFFHTTDLDLDLESILLSTSSAFIGRRFPVPTTSRM